MLDMGFEPQNLGCELPNSPGCNRQGKLDLLARESQPKLMGAFVKDSSNKNLRHKLKDEWNSTIWAVNLLMNTVDKNRFVEPSFLGTARLSFAGHSMLLQLCDTLAL